AEISSMMRLVTEIRRFRSDQGLRPSQRVAARLAGIEATPLAGHEERIRSLLRLDTVAPAADGFTASASIEAEGLTAGLHVAGALAAAAAGGGRRAGGAGRGRREKARGAPGPEAARGEKKLPTPAFPAKPPPATGEKTRQRLETAQADIARLEQRLAVLARGD